MRREKALEIAAQIWCKPGLTDRTMDPPMAEAIADEIEAIADGLSEDIVDSLSDMVSQHCHRDEKHGYFSGAISANADAMRTLGRIGVMDIDDRGYRIVYGKFKGKT